MAVLDSQIYKRIEWRLYHYFDTKHQAEDLVEEQKALLNPGRTPASPGGGGVSRKSDPTATNTLKRMQLVSPQREAAKWAHTIERTIARYEGTEKGTLLELKYFSDMSEDYICGILNIERATFFNWRNEIVLFTALVAAQEGLIRVS